MKYAELVSLAKKEAKSKNNDKYKNTAHHSAVNVKMNIKKKDKNIDS